jgi:hypothetical protein
MVPILVLAELQRGDLVLTPLDQTCTVLGISMAGRATIRDEQGTVIAINIDQLRKIAPSYR